MATLIVEDGTKIPNANSYVTLTEADDYFELLSNDFWIAEDTERNANSLILATQSVDLLYGHRYESSIEIGSNQALLWPRMFFWDADGREVPSNSIPPCLKNAVCEIALMEQSGINIFPVDSRGNLIRAEGVQVGGVAINKSYWAPKVEESYEGFRKVDMLLRPILKQVGSSAGGYGSGMWRLIP